MKTITIQTFVLLIAIAFTLPNSAPYIKAKNRPLNIAHRGLCSILPQNTLQAFQAALYQGADFIQLDVVYTKQKIALVMHDPYLSRITNIKEFPQFSTRKETRYYEGKEKEDWWTDKFTLQQLQRLGIRQNQAPGRLTRFDYKFTFPTLQDVVDMVIKFNAQHKGVRNPDGRLAGILIEAKDSQMYRDMYQLEIGQTILEVLRKKNISDIKNASAYCLIYLHSFDYGTIKYWASKTQLPRNFLIQGNTSINLEDINRYANGIGFQDLILWNYNTNEPTEILSKTRQLGLLVHIWTFKDDMLLFNARDNLQMYQIGQKKLCLDGVITQSSDIYAAVSQLYKNQTNFCQPSVRKNRSIRRSFGDY